MEDHDGEVIDMQDSSDEWLHRREVQDTTQEDMAQEDTAQEGVQQAEEMQTDMREIRYPVVGFGFEQLNAMQQEYNDQRQVQLDQMQVQLDQMLGSARRQQHFKAPPACHCAPALW